MGPQQRGGVLLLFALLVVLTASAFIFAWPMGPVDDPVQRDAARLAEAKELVLGYAIANRARPGELPFPDRHGDGNYDGNGDCVSDLPSLLDGHLLGKWPAWLEQGCGPTHRTALGIELRDGGGRRLWYAASPNLLFPAPALHSNVATGWLTLRARDGAVLANDVAFLLVAPGPTVAGQSRSSLPGAGEFLDSTAVGGAVHHNGNGDRDFIAGVASDAFNDRIAFVTRGEFFGGVTQRVAGELARRLEAHRALFGTYPPAADAAGNCDPGLAIGRFPEAMGSCAAVPPAPAPWFGANWRAVTHYARLAPSRAELRFDGCPAIVYHLDAGDRTRSGRTC